MINKAMKIARDVLKVSDEELAAIEEIAQQQMDYISPLKAGTSARQQKLGQYNMKIVGMIRELREHIRNGVQS